MALWMHWAIHGRALWQGIKIETNAFTQNPKAHLTKLYFLIPRVHHLFDNEPGTTTGSNNVALHSHGHQAAARVGPCKPRRHFSYDQSAKNSRPRPTPQENLARPFEVEHFPGVR